MPEFKLEGDLQGFRKPQLEYINKILERKGFKNPKVSVEPVGKAGDNYMANIKRVEITENGETLKMVVKLASDNPILRQSLNVASIYQNEHFMYTEVFPKFVEKQISAGVPENERFRFPKCYGSYIEAPNEMILLEDLKESDFEILNRFEPLSEESVKIAIRSFAIYHALSFAIRYQEPETYANFQKRLSPSLEIDPYNEDSAKFFNYLEEQIIDITDARYQKLFKGSVVNHVNLEFKMRKFAKDSKYTVIQHGDGWTSNIMFRFENNVPVECVLIDYQLVRENSPVYDLMFMLFNSTTHKQRSQHFYEYIDYYHKELDKALYNYGLKANFLYPRDKLDADLKIYGKQILASTLIMSSLITKSTDEAEKMKEAMEFTDHNDADTALSMVLARGEKSFKMLKEKAEGLAESFTEFGLL